MQLELAWGRLRRWYLKRFRAGYVERMRQRRRGVVAGCPLEPLDPRDLKYYRNVAGCYWDRADDPFTWRDRLPFARAGLTELLVIGGGLLGLAALLAWWSWMLALGPALLALSVVWFFRDPPRHVPQEAGVVVAPADGRVVDVQPLDSDPFVGEPAVRVGIFLSVFNVHVNRSPAAARVVEVVYRPGKFLNALRPASVRENEQLELRLEETAPPFRRFVVRQIAGTLARRIVCWVAPGEPLERGVRYGMIKLGSRTDLILPCQGGLEVLVRPGQAVRAGRSIVARYPMEGSCEGN